MRRKPAIILFLLLLLLSIGGAVFHQVRKDLPPTLPEVDAFLKNEAASGDWQYVSYDSTPLARIRKFGWWDYLRIRRNDTFQVYRYTFVRSSGASGALVEVTINNGSVVRLDIWVDSDEVVEGGPPGAPIIQTDPDLNGSIYGRFPQLPPRALEYVP